MIPRERARAVLDKRNTTKLRRGPRDFPFSGLIIADTAAVSSSVSPTRGATSIFTAPATKVNAASPMFARRSIAARFPELMGRLHFSEKVHQWIVAGLHQQSGLVLKGRGGPSVCAFLTKLSLN